MKLLKGTLTLALTATLTACGGGGSEGYFNNQSSNSNNSNTSGSGNSNTGATEDYTAQTTQFNAVLDREAKALFGTSDITDDNQQKGYFDHAFDTFGNGPLQLAIDAKKAFDQDPSKFEYLPQCMSSGTYTNTGCYALIGDDIDHILKDVLNSVSNNKYANWDFDVNKSDIAGMKMTADQITQYTGKTVIIIFENENKDKNLNDVWVSGAFKYPFQQSWGLTQSTQTRIVSMNQDSSEYAITLTLNGVSDTKGALSVYKNPLYKNGIKYDIQNESAFSVLTNDNPQEPAIEPVTFTVGSKTGAPSISSYIINNDKTEELSLPNVTIQGLRTDNLTPSTNSKTISGSLFYKYNPNQSGSTTTLFQFINALKGATFDFNHKLKVEWTEQDKNDPALTINNAVTRTITGTSTHLDAKNIDTKFITK